MAKSIRSKWKRKCRAVKRERYGKKELERLQRTLNNDPHNKPQDIAMSDIASQVTVVEKPVLRSRQGRKSEATAAVEDEQKMETNAKERIFNPKTMKDQYGTYPVWMSQRKVRKNQKIQKAKKKNKKRKKF